MAQPITCNESSPLFRCINYILDTVDEKGAWGGTDFEDWEPVITALTLNFMLSLGFTPETNWVVAKGTKLHHRNLLLTLQYLDMPINENGSFGEDIWDVVRLGYIIEHNDLEDRFTKYSSLKKYILETIDTGAIRGGDTTWSGPGTIAAAIDYLDATNETEKGDSLFNHLLSLQFDDGSFHGPVNEVNDELVHPIWHTTQVLMTSLRRMPSEKDERIKKMTAFICNTQDSSKGCWRAFSHYGVYFTSYAIIALNSLNSKPRDVIEKAINWVSDQVSKKGKIRDSGGTIMGVLALATEYPNQLIFQASIAEVRKLEVSETVIADLNDKLGILQRELESSNGELSSYKNKFDLADIVLTKADVFKWAILLSVVGIGLSFFLGVVPQLVNSSKTQTVILVPEQNIQKYLPDIKTPLSKTGPDSNLSNKSDSKQTVEDFKLKEK